ncbi:unnamed protein product [marine sediment metagenome]|uniref:Uncharacterized protein n=1 Tax=marine sediment metagenome TaxID=412755 RepID=X0YM94_9ZZZZ
MSKLPKLKVKRYYGDPPEETRDFEQAQYMLFDDQSVVLVEDQITRSYEELVELATQDRYKDKEFLEVLLFPSFIGGG